MREYQDELSLSKVLFLFRKRRKVAGIPFCLCVAAGIIVSAVLPAMVEVKEVFRLPEHTGISGENIFGQIDDELKLGFYRKDIAAAMRIEEKDIPELKISLYKGDLVQVGVVVPAVKKEQGERVLDLLFISLREKFIPLVDQKRMMLDQRIGLLKTSLSVIAEKLKLLDEDINDLDGKIRALRERRGAYVPAGEDQPPEDTVGEDSAEYDSGNLSGRRESLFIYASTIDDRLQGLRREKRDKEALRVHLELSRGEKQVQLASVEQERESVRNMQQFSPPFGSFENRVPHRLAIMIVTVLLGALLSFLSVLFTEDWQRRVL